MRIFLGNKKFVSCQKLSIVLMYKSGGTSRQFPLSPLKM